MFCGDPISTDALTNDASVNLETIIIRQLPAIKASLEPGTSDTMTPYNANRDVVSISPGTNTLLLSGVKSSLEPGTAYTITDDVYWKPGTKPLMASIHASGEKCDETFRSRHFMTISGKAGRLGNHLFQLSMLLATARRYCYSAVVPPAWNKLLNSTFTIPAGVFEETDMTNARMLDDWKCCQSVSIYNEVIDHLSADYNWTFRGYFQSFRYFRGQAAFIRESYQFRPSVMAPVGRVLDAVTGILGDVTVVAVHVRRGDMAHDDHLINIGFAVAGVEYLQKAMQYFRKRFRRTVFIVASDEIEWCRDNIRSDDVVFSPLSQPAHDMALIANCDHVIITSGSFGWWGAWLNGGTVVYFKGFPADGSQLGQMYNKQDYYPEHWIGID